MPLEALPGRGSMQLTRSGWPSVPSAGQGVAGVGGGRPEGLCDGTPGPAGGGQSGAAAEGGPGCSLSCPRSVTTFATLRVVETTKRNCVIRTRARLVVVAKQGPCLLRTDLVMCWKLPGVCEADEEVVGTLLGPLESAFILPDMLGYLVGSFFLNLGCNPIWKLGRRSMWPELTVYHDQLSTELS